MFGIFLTNKLPNYYLIVLQEHDKVSCELSPLKGKNSRKAAQLYPTVYVNESIAHPAEQVIR